MDSSVTQAAVRLRASLSALQRQLRLALPPQRIGVARLGVLGLLHRHGALAPSELAAHARVKLQTLTRLLAELEADGWIARAADPADGRRTVLSLTRLGLRELSADTHRREASLAAAMEAALNGAQQAALLRACDSLDALADELGRQAQAAAEKEKEKGGAGVKRPSPR